MAKASSAVGAKRARAKKGEASGAASLIEALKFIGLAQHKEGTPPQTHCAIGNGRIVAFDGVIAAGHLIEDDLSACPHTTRFLDALGKCGASLSITQLDSGRLSIKSDRFKAFVPCMNGEHLSASTLEPDPPCALIDDRLKAGFALVAPILSETAQRAAFAGALLQAGSIVGTNGHVLIEFWHGIDLPPGLLIPKAALQAIIKTPKKLSRFGFSPNSATFYFEDDSFIRSQLYNETYPQYAQIFPNESNPWPLPEGFFEGMNKIQSLSDDKILYFDVDGFVVKDAQRNQSGAYQIEGLQSGLAFNMDYLCIIEPIFKQVHFDNGRAVFFGDNARGVLMGIGQR
jgi:hypothetical protein